MTSGVMWAIFGSYDSFMIVYPAYLYHNKWPFCLVVMTTLNLKKNIFLNDNSSKTTEAVWL